MLVVLAALLLYFGHYGWAATVVALLAARLALSHAVEGLLAEPVANKFDVIRARSGVSRPQSRRAPAPAAHR